MIKIQKDELQKYERYINVLRTSSKEENYQLSIVDARNLSEDEQKKVYQAKLLNYILKMNANYGQMFKKSEDEIIDRFHHLLDVVEKMPAYKVNMFKIFNNEFGMVPCEQSELVGENLRNKIFIETLCKQVHFDLTGVPVPKTKEITKWFNKYVKFLFLYFSTFCEKSE